MYRRYNNNPIVYHERMTGMTRSGQTYTYALRGITSSHRWKRFNVIMWVLHRHLTGTE